jgi:hypothetical protein
MVLAFARTTAGVVFPVANAHCSRVYPGVDEQRGVCASNFILHCGKKIAHSAG